MTRAEWETVLGMVAVAVSCALPGVLLLLRRMILVADAISHVLLLGIVLAYFLVQDAASPWLFFGAALSGLLTVALVESLARTRHIREDAAIGLVFPALFSLGVLLASLRLRNIHLDVDRVLFGSAELMPFDRMNWFGLDLPRGMVIPGLMILVQTLLVLALYKELQLSVFDAQLAAVFGFAPLLLHYGLMACVSLTAVAAFDAVGPVLMLVFFAVPPATARLFTNRLDGLLMLSCGVAAAVAALATWIAFRLDTTLAGTAATLMGLVFFLAMCLAPQRGLLAQAWQRRQRQRRFHEVMLLIHLRTHENTAAEASEAAFTKLPKHLAWTQADVEALVRRAEDRGWVVRQGPLCQLTAAGRAWAEKAQQTRRWD